MTNIDISPEAVERLIAGFEEFCLNEGIRLECVSQERAALRALSAALTKSRAETAAAYKRAAETAEDHVTMRINQIETEKSKAAINIDVPQVMRWGAGKVQAEVIRDAIRALATPDQTAALDKLIAEAVADKDAEIEQLNQDLSDMRDNAESAYRRGYWAGGNGA